MKTKSSPLLTSVTKAKAERRLYDLGGKELLSLQKKAVEKVKKMLNDELDRAIKAYAQTPEPEAQKVQKFLQKDDIEELESILAESFTIGVQQILAQFKDTVGLTPSFEVGVEEVLAWAVKQSARQVTFINSTTESRIASIVTESIKEGYGYQWIAETLQKDFAFSEARAILIASHEIGEAYLNGKDAQFKKYESSLGVKGYKKWVSHKDDRTTSGCYENDLQGWIQSDDTFQSGHDKPTRFPGCRCNCIYRLEKPE